MSKNFRDVVEFNKKVIKLNLVDYLNSERLSWFKSVINEELGEFEVANEKYKAANSARVIRALDMGNRTAPSVPSNEEFDAKAEMADAIIDLLYFAFGRLYEIGITEEEFDLMWDEVQAANMAKVKGNKGRGSDDDAIKPEGWKAPEKNFKRILLGERHSENHRLLPSRPEYDIRWNKDNGLGVAPNVEIKHVSGTKYDEDKPNMALVFGGFPNALIDVAQVGTFGARKYTPEGWKSVDNLQQRYMSALLRHIFAILRGNPIDSETGRHHLAHVAWNALALLEDLFLTTLNYNSYDTSAKAQAERTLEKYFENKGK